ncbi:hypothetical protein [Marilutibacter aestuarii]|uniref:hypothetical protein n=1 Tax=Marilutibacter aestuarii TaxID=1706195 RepID=UPI0014773B22|nr:hypothetical protein [Lysobacter aestuarii]
MPIHMIITLVYAGVVFGVLGYGLWLATRLVDAQRRTADALVAIAARLDAGGA